MLVSNVGLPNIVLDTNVLVSGLLSPHGALARILDLVISGNVIIVLDGRIFSEYADVMRREKFSFPEDAVNEIITFIEREGIFISPLPLNCSVPVPGDLPFIEVSRHADVPVVTGNLRHFRGSGAQVMTPVQFFSGLEKS